MPLPSSRTLRQSVLTLAALALALLLASPTAWAASAAEPRHLTQELPIGDARWVTLDFPVGQLEITASDERVVRVELQISCTAEPKECDKLAGKLKIDSRRKGEKLAIEVKGPHKNDSKGVKFRGIVTAPRDLPLSVDMSVGDLRARGFRHDLYIDLGVGNAQVALPESVVRSVDLESGVGDVELALPSGRIEGTGFVGKGLRWTGGQGSSVIEVDCGVGNVEVALE